MSGTKINISIINLVLRRYLIFVKSNNNNTIKRYLFKLSSKNSYQKISGVSKWIHEELIIINYNDNKLIKALQNKDYKIIEYIIKFVENKYILDEYLTKIYYHPFFSNN